MTASSYKPPQNGCQSTTTDGLSHNAIKSLASTLMQLVQQGHKVTVSSCNRLGKTASLGLVSSLLGSMQVTVYGVQHGTWEDEWEFGVGEEELLKRGYHSLKPPIIVEQDVFSTPKGAAEINEALTRSLRASLKRHGNIPHE